MAIKIFCPNEGHASITTRFPSAVFDEFGLELVQHAGESDVICAALVEELEQLLYVFGDKKSYFLWCDEPLWSNIFRVIDKHENTLSFGDSVIVIHAMNCFTGNVLFSNGHFLTRQYHLDQYSIESFRAKRASTGTHKAERNICAFLAYRNGGIWDYKHPSGIQSLNTLRTRLALEGVVCGKVDVRGAGWPSNWTNWDSNTAQDSQSDTDIFVEKLNELTKYKFSICFENSMAPYYVTEKIWHSILAGCLPIYYAGENHTIYQEFEKDSFVDYAKFEHPSQLFDFIEGMEEFEFNRRISLCDDALDRAVARTNSGTLPAALQIKMFADRVKQVVRI